MKKLFLAVAMMGPVLGAGIILRAHGSEPAGGTGQNIANAHWRDYMDMYPKSALCEAKEITLWTCEGNRTTYSLCSSREITEDAGYIQYRAGRGHEATFLFPQSKRHPAGVFNPISSLSGDVSVTFENEGYRYTLVDRLRGTSSISVSKEPDDTGVAYIACSNENQSLQLNYTLKLMGYSRADW